MKKLKGQKLLIITTAVLLIFNSCAESVNRGLVAETNLKRLGIEQANLDRIDSLLGSALINNWAAGVTALVAVNGKVIYDKGLGFRDRESKALANPVTFFRIASMTKPIVTAAAMKLVEEGSLKLDDPVSKFIPEFKNAKVIATFNKADTTYTTVDAKTPITIKHLMTHTSGIGYGFAHPTLNLVYKKNSIPDLAVADNIILQDKMSKLGTLPLAVQPGSQFLYGLNTDVLGAVIEKVSGKKLDEYLQENIFKPLSMDNTYFFIPTEKAHRLAVMYTETRDGRLDRMPNISQGYNVNYPVDGAKKYLSGGSGLSSTVEDYAKFCQMILNKGEFNNKRILQPETVELMTTNQVGNLMVGKNKFGLGFEIATTEGLKNGAKVGKLSWGGIFNTMFWIDPERRSIAILMTQVYPAIHKNQLYNQFEQIVNDALDR